MPVIRTPRTSSWTHLRAKAPVSIFAIDHPQAGNTRSCHEAPATVARTNLCRTAMVGFAIAALTVWLIGRNRAKPATG